MKHYELLDSPIGQLLLLGDEEALHEIRFEPEAGGHELPPGATRGGAQLVRAREQLEAWFRGEREDFDLPLAPEGTDFMKSVWNELRRIPRGETISYGELARRIGRPTAARAVGLANGKNPIPIVVPCHRVIGADGSLTGFAGGLERKRALLRLEAGASPEQQELFEAG